MHWFTSGTPSFLVNALKRYHFSFEKIEGGYFINSELYSTNCFQTLLFQAGYLTIKEYIPPIFGKFSRFPKYRLGIPNQEVKDALSALIGANFSTSTNSLTSFIIE